MKEFRIFGPPGTGKTTRIAKQTIPAAVERYGPEGVMVVSYTRAAAKEIASREIEVEPESVGTLHAICYRAFGRPEIAESHFDQWNSMHKNYALTGAKVQTLDDGAEGYDSGASEGDKYLARVNIYRSRMIPKESWTVGTRYFYSCWQKFKEDNSYMDFTDLIERAISDIPRAPGKIKVLIADEAQDFTPLQFRLIRSWGLLLDWIVTVGDDDQTIYSFTGAQAEAFFLPPVPERRKTVLSQSYRVPRSVHEISSQLIGRVKNREPKEYLPRDDAGEVKTLMTSYKETDDIVSMASNYSRQGKTVMILASCSYMLAPIKTALLESGVPFQNAYRRRRRDWNPLFPYSGGVSGAEMLRAFVSSGVDEPYWNVPSLLKWIKFMKVGDDGLIRKTGRQVIDVLEGAVADKKSGLHTSRKVLSKILSPAALNPAINRDIDWLADNCVGPKRGALAFPRKVIKQHGIEALTETPRVTLGTIHSVKGGESDVVMLAPDISHSASNEMIYDAGRDSVHRVFYVGMTRARETLVLMSPARGNHFVEL